MVPLLVSAVIVGLLAWRTSVWDAGDGFEGFWIWAAIAALAPNVPILAAIVLRSITWRHLVHLPVKTPFSSMSALHRSAEDGR